jgi:MinD superfamily P-loop ATPase
MYRTHMKKRGPNLERAYQGLPGISVEVDPEKCEGCATCVDRCFVGVMELREGTAFPGESCKGCGRCVEVCPQKAALLRIDNEDVLYGQLVERINDVSDILGSS